MPEGQAEIEELLALATIRRILLSTNFSPSHLGCWSARWSSGCKEPRNDLDGMTPRRALRSCLRTPQRTTAPWEHRRRLAAQVNVLVDSWLLPGTHA